MKRLLVAIGFMLGLTLRALATCAVSVPAGSIQVVDCNQESVVANSPYYTLTDAAGLPLGFWFAWSNSGVTLASGVPVSGQLAFTNGNPLISWPAHGLTAGSYLVLTTTLQNPSAPGTLPPNFTGSTLSSQTVYYVLSTGLTTNAFELSATPGGAAITPSASSTGAVYGLNLIAGFNAWANSVFALAKLQQQAAAVVPPAQIVVTPAQ
jgi:hypothetical protein